MIENESHPIETEAEAYKRGREIALRRLSRRECSTDDLRRKMIQKGISADIAAKIVEDLAQSSLVDDERFSRMFVRQQMLQSKGSRLIRQKLHRQGIALSAEKISEISSDVIDTTDTQRARAFVERKYPTAFEDKKVAARASQALARRGFSYDVIRQALNAHYA